MSAPDLIPAGIASVVPPSDSGRNEGGPVGALWERLTRTDWSSSAAAYLTATDARRIITLTGMTIKAFAAECNGRRIAGFGSQSSVSRRLRWAELHDQLWEAGVLPRNVFVSEAASRPLFDGKLTAVQRLKLLAELFGSHLSDEEKRRLAGKLNEALMREHLTRHGDSGRNFKASRTLIPEKVIARLLAQGMSAGAIAEMARRLEDSARNAAEGMA